MATLDSTARRPKPRREDGLKRRRRPCPGSSGLGPRTPRCACACVPLSGPGNHRCASPSRVRAVPDCRVGGALPPACRPRRPPFLSEPCITRRAAALESARCSSARALPRGTRSCGGGSRITRCGSAPSSRTSISSTSRSTGSQTRSRSRSAPFARAVELLCTITGIQHRGAQCILADIGTIICAIWHMLLTGAL